MKRNLITACLVLLILSVSAWTQVSKPQWEYKIEYNATEKKLNQLAAQGWELIAVSPDAETKNLTGFYFKRAQ